MNRHQRRKRCEARRLARERRETVKANLSTPALAERSDGLVSHVYRGNAMDRARGFGVTPMTRPASGYRVLKRSLAGEWTGFKSPEHFDQSVRWYHQRKK